MSLSSTNSRNDYVGSGSTATYSYTFKIFSASDLSVSQFVLATGLVTPLILNTDYTVTGVGNASGGTIVLTAGNLAVTNGLVIRRVGALTQGTSIRNQGDFYPEVHEDTFDKLVMIAQQHQEQLDRSVKIPVNMLPANFDPTLPAAAATTPNAPITVNASGTGLALGAVGGGTTVTSVFGRSGTVTAQTGDYTKAQVGLGNVDNTSDVNKPVSTAQASALAPIAAAVPTGGTTGQVLAKNSNANYDLIWSAAGGGGSVTLTGDVTGSGTGSFATAIATNAVTNTKAAQMPANTLKGNNTAGLANAADLTVAQVTALIGVTASTPSSLAERDANGNIRANNFNEGFATTATAAGTTTLTVASAYAQQFTGTTTQTVVLPDATTLVLGQAFQIMNRSTGIVTVNANGGGLVQTMAAGSQVIVTCASIGSAPGVWDAAYSTASAGGGFTSPLTTKGDIHTYTTTDARLAVGADGTTLQADSSQPAGIKWAAAQAGVKNYISNPNFEYAITPWSLFNTTLTSGIPSGGITLTASSLNALARTSTNPLAGTNSLQVSSAGAVTAGQGFISGAFTIDRKDEGKVLYFQVPYEVVSGSANMDFSGTSTQSFAVYIYDVTASAWIQPTGFRGMNQSKNPGMVSGSFQASVVAGQQYQLAVVAINATGGAVTINFDEMLVGPQTIVTGSAVSDAQAYTPTFTGFGSPTAVSAYYRRNGDRLECWGAFTSGTSTAVLAKISLPNSYAIDTSKLPVDQSASLGDVTVGVAAGSPYPSSSTAGPFKITQSNATDPRAVFMSVSTSTSNMFNLANGSNIAASGQVVAFQFSAPILGWSSNVQLSQDTDTRVVAALLTAGTFTINNTFQDVTFTATRDSNGAYSGTNYTVQVSGWYEINADMRGGTSTASAQIGLKLFKNGSQIKDGTDSYVLTGANQWVRLHYKDYFVAGDILKLQAALPTGVTVASAPVMDITRVSGPSVIAASEAINASYVTTAGAAVAASTLTFIDFGTKEWDSHGAVVGAGGGNTTTVQTGWRFVVQNPGKYRVTSQVTYASQSGGAASLNFYIYQNATVKANPAILSTTSVWPYGMNFSRTLNCVAGDTIQIAVNQNAGASTLNTGVGSNYVNIELVK